MKRIAAIVASAGGAGYLPIAPGTWGTAVGCLLIYVLGRFQLISYEPWIILSAGVVLSIVSHYLISYLPETWEHDDGKIVIDEVIGMLITMIFVPITLLNLFLGFVLFRIFDIWKPLGIRKFDDLQTDWGVIADDVLAGIYANVTLQVVIVLLLWI